MVRNRSRTTCNLPGTLVGHSKITISLLNSAWFGRYSGFLVWIYLGYQHTTPALRALAIESQVTVTARTRARENPKCYSALCETAARSAAKILLQCTMRNSRAQRENLPEHLRNSRAQRGKFCYRALCETAARCKNLQPLHEMFVARKLVST